MDSRIQGSTLPDVSAVHGLIPHFTCGSIAPTSRSIRVPPSELSNPWSKTGRKLVDPNLQIYGDTRLKMALSPPYLFSLLCFSCAHFPSSFVLASS
jgi:hypothetical protein